MQIRHLLLSSFFFDFYCVAEDINYSAIGDDALGKELVENFNSKNVRYHLDTVPYPTGTVQVELDEAGVPQYEIKENVAWDNIPHCKYDTSYYQASFLIFIV